MKVKPSLLKGILVLLGYLVTAGLIFVVLRQGAGPAAHEDRPGPQTETLLPNPSEAKNL